MSFSFCCLQGHLILFFPPPKPSLSTMGLVEETRLGSASLSSLLQTGSNGRRCLQAAGPKVTYADLLLRSWVLWCQMLSPIIHLIVWRIRQDCFCLMNCSHILCITLSVGGANHPVPTRSLRVSSSIRPLLTLFVRFREILPKVTIRVVFQTPARKRWVSFNYTISCVVDLSRCKHCILCIPH